MPKSFSLVTAALALVSFGTAGSVLGQPPVPIPEPPSTLWRFLGIPQTVTGAYDSVANRRGNRPGLERRGRGARVRRIADPAFLQPEAPPLLKTAAQIKMQEDLAPQKIKALEYLGTIGCGCYDKDGEVTAAILEGLADCTEEVRLTAVEVISEGAASEYCQYCQQRSCCNPELAKKLDELANGQDNQGCWLEPSERVRAAAARALATCGPIVVESRPLDATQEEVDRGEDLPPTPRADGATPPAQPNAPPSLPAPQASRRAAPIRSSRRHSPPLTATPERVPPGDGSPGAGGVLAELPAAALGEATLALATDDAGDLYNLFQPEGRVGNALVSNAGPSRPRVSPMVKGPTQQAKTSGTRGNIRPRRPSNTRGGVVEAVDEAHGVVRVRFDHDGQVAAGAPVSIVHKTLIGGIRVSGRVDRWESGYATVRPFESELVNRLARGDSATLYIPQPKRISR